MFTESKNRDFSIRNIAGLEKFGHIVIEKHSAIIEAWHWLEYSLFYIGK